MQRNRTGTGRPRASAGCRLEESHVTRYVAPLIVLAALVSPAFGAVNFSNNILITGYWPPTNNMLRQFSRNEASNPDGWKGSNWEGRGYNIHSYFPEFPNGLGQGVGDLEVDYQDTAADWAWITETIKPVAIITFSRANTQIGWEMEPAYRRFRLSGEPPVPGQNVPFYSSDYTSPFQPSNVPIAGETPGNVREGTLPMQEIVDAVAGEISPSLVQPFIANYDPNNLNNGYDFGGSFLSGYIGYLGAWYQNEHSDPDAEWRTFAAGHIHVGLNMQLSAAEQATEVTLRTLIDHLDSVIPVPIREAWGANERLPWTGEFQPPPGHVPAPGAAAVVVLGGIAVARRQR